MIITLIGHERNLGILTLTDHLISKLGKSNCVVVGWNYLIAEYNLDSMASKINSACQDNKSVIIKYVIPRARFSSDKTTIIYPDLFKEMSDVIFRVPSYREEISSEVPKIFFKGGDNAIVKHIEEFYSPIKVN